MELSYFCSNISFILWKQNKHGKHLFKKMKLSRHLDYHLFEN